MHTSRTISVPQKAEAAASPDTDLHQLLTVADVAAVLNVSKSWVYEHTRSRSLPRTEQLPFVKLGKYVRFHPRLVREFIARCATRA